MDEFINAAVELIAAYQDYYVASRAYDESNRQVQTLVEATFALRPDDPAEIDAGIYEALERVGLTEGDAVYEAVTTGLRLGNAELN